MTSNQPACGTHADSTKQETVYLEFVERVVRDYEELAFAANSVRCDPPGEWRRRMVADGGWEEHLKIIDDGRDLLKRAGRFVAGPEAEILPDPRRRRGRPRKVTK